MANDHMMTRDGILRGAAQKKKGQKKGRPAVWSNVIYLSLCYVLSMFLCCVMSRSPTVKGAPFLSVGTEAWLEWQKGAAMKTRKKGALPRAP